MSEACLRRHFLLWAYFSNQCPLNVNLPKGQVMGSFQTLIKRAKFAPTHGAPHTTLSLPTHDRKMVKIGCL